MKSNTLKSLVLVFGIALFMSSSAFAQSKDRQERKELNREKDERKRMYRREANERKRNKPRRR